MGDNSVDLGVELLANLERESLTLAEALDHIDTVTTDPALQRRILETADRRGAIERDGRDVIPQRGTFVRFERAVVTKDGEFSCRRCGASLSTGYFIQFDAGEFGPFGSTCIRVVTGR